MAIGTAVQRSSIVYVYDEKGSLLFSLPSGMNEKDGLTGYTSGTVTIRRANIIYTYNDKGQQISTTHV